MCENKTMKVVEVKPKRERKEFRLLNKGQCFKHGGRMFIALSGVQKWDCLCLDTMRLVKIKSEVIVELFESELRYK